MVCFFAYVFKSDVGIVYRQQIKITTLYAEYLLQCKPVLEYILDNNSPEDSAGPSTDDSTLPSKLLNLLTHKLRQNLKEVVAIHVKKR